MQFEELDLNYWTKEDLLRWYNEEKKMRKNYYHKCEELTEIISQYQERINTFEERTPSILLSKNHTLATTQDITSYIENELMWMKSEYSTKISRIPGAYLSIETYQFILKYLKASYDWDIKEIKSALSGMREVQEECARIQLEMEKYLEKNKK